MQMVVRKILVGIFPFILIACAQVGQLTGGEQDVFAPKPVKIIPTSEQVLFKENRILLSFDEYFTLSNPQQTIILVPKDAQINATYKQKTLKLDIDGLLRDSTTYVIYLDGTVKDITEGNDSLITYVFSTGSAIDSLSCRVIVSDAWSCLPLGQVTVGFFDSINSLRPIYFAKSDQRGIAEIKHLKRGTYYLKAFQDKNKDLYWQSTEKLGFSDSVFNIYQSINDTIPLRLSMMPEKSRKTNVNFIPSGCFAIKSAYSLEQAEFIFNGKPISEKELIHIQPDSVLLFANINNLNEAPFVIKTKDKIDSIAFRIPSKDRNKSISLTPLFKTQEIAPIEPIGFSLYDLIDLVDNKKIHVFDPQDSLISINFSILVSKNEFSINFNRTNHNKITIQLDEGAVTTLNKNESRALKQKLILNTEINYGVIRVKLDHFINRKGGLIVELLQGNNTIKRQLLTNDTDCEFSSVIPGDYQFRVICDTNKNGKWDGGNIDLLEQPEKIYLFPKPISVKGNWDISIELIP